MTRRKQYLYVRVEKVKDVADSCDPYAEVRLGNYMGTTRDSGKKSNPDLGSQVFAFSRDKIDHGSVLEVTVKDLNVANDDFMGWVLKDLCEVPKRVPIDGPVAAEWYRLKDRKGKKVKGEVMLAVWWGTQADEAFPEAWHSDAAYDADLRSKVYLLPKLWYLRVMVIEAQILMPTDKISTPEVCVKAALGRQTSVTRICTSICTSKSTGFEWKETLMFVAEEPFDVPLTLSVVDRFGRNLSEVLGMCEISLQDQQAIKRKQFEIWKHDAVDGENTKGSKFAGWIRMEICLEGGYHVLDEDSQYTSDFRPSSKKLWKKSIGVVELGILNAHGLPPMKVNDERGTTDAYCVAKYGRKWVKTKTITDSVTPEWLEQYAWEVFDPCTVLTIGVFDNCHLQDGGMSGRAKDSRIGKVRIRLSNLETNCIYTSAYPLLALHPSGLKKNGELFLAVRFTCTSWLNMMHMYSQPLLPEMHYIHPLLASRADYLRYQAMHIVSMNLARAEPPLRTEVVEYMLDVGHHMWSLRRSKATFFRIMGVLGSLFALGKWFDDVYNWKNPITTLHVHIFFCVLVLFPKFILPSFFLYLFLIGVWNLRYRPRYPMHIDTRLSYADNVHPDELDEEFDPFPTSRPSDIVRMRYDRLRSLCGRVQTIADDLATQGERLQSILTWRDPRATAMFIIFCLFAAVLLYATPFHTVVIQTILIVLRHPMFRHKRPPVPLNFFRRLPSRVDSMI